MCEQNTSKVLKDNLIILRRRSRMTQEQLAGKLGLTFQAVSKWETEFPEVKETTYKLTLTLLPIQKNKDLLEVLLWLRT